MEKKEIPRLNRGISFFFCEMPHSVSQDGVPLYHYQPARCCTFPLLIIASHDHTYALPYLTIRNRNESEPNCSEVRITLTAPRSA